MTRFINKGSNSPAANRTTSIRRKYARNRIALVLLMTCLIATYACQNKSQLDAQRPPASVTVVSAVSQDVPVYLDAIGKTVAREVVSDRKSTRLNSSHLGISYAVFC